MNTICNTEVEWQVRRIPFDAITVDPAVQQRAAGTSRDVVDEYVEAMRNGVESSGSPPLVGTFPMPAWFVDAIFGLAADP
jgi:hypothetical protein